VDIGQKFARAYRAQTNARAERFIPSPLSEWAHGRSYTPFDARNAAPPEVVVSLGTHTGNALRGFLSAPRTL